MPLIELRDIRKIYTLGDVEVQALAGVSLDIDRGEYRGFPPGGRGPARGPPGLTNSATLPTAWNGS